MEKQLEQRNQAAEQRGIRLSRPLSHGVAQLSGVYQALSLMAVLHLMWYSEEVGYLFPPYEAFKHIFIQPVFSALTIDVYHLDDLELRQKMLMIVQGVALAAFFLLLQRLSSRYIITGAAGVPGSASTRWDFLSAVTSSTTWWYILYGLEVVEYFLIVNDFSTEELVNSIIPNLQESLFENLCVPVMNWMLTIGAWFLSNIATSALLTVVIHFGYLFRYSVYRPGDSGFRLFLKQFLLSRILIVVTWWFFEVSSLTIVTSWQTFLCLCVRSLAFSGCVNLENQRCRTTKPPLTPHMSPVPALDPDQITSTGASKTSEPSGAGVHELPWDTAKVGYGQVLREVCDHLRSTVLRPLFLLLGSLSVVLLPHTVALLVVICGMYLFAIWFPAALFVTSTDFFSNVAAVCVLISVFRHNGHDPFSAASLERAGWVYTYVMEFNLVLSFLQRSMGTGGAVLVLLCFMLLYPDLLDNVRVLGFAVAGVIAFAAHTSAQLPGLLALARRLLHSAISSVMLFTVLSLAYCVPMFWIPLQVPKFPLILVIALPLAGMMKELEGPVFIATDAFFFDLHADPDSDDDADDMEQSALSFGNRHMGM
eukprot:TRINITY_DN19535_c0_g1_i1.p1 TRINITY_DN19535_c0_g1~~TRINITY_DN19535_c0_g1_i1.p1  ORF type:complete len:593 (+),score=171.14 TRINITY_DN19535_c0_g1_i1:99-1877(+)